MSRLTGDGTAEPVSRDQILRHVRGQRGIFIFPVQLTTSRIGNLTRLIHTLLSKMGRCRIRGIAYLQNMTIQTYIHDQCEWHGITRTTGPDCAVMRNLITIHTYIHTIPRPISNALGGGLPDSDCCGVQHLMFSRL